MNECPRCKRSNIVTGSLLAKWDTEGVGGERVAVFEPDGLEHWALRLHQGIRTQPPLVACVDCGLVWTEVAAAELAEFLRKNGTEETKRLVSQSSKEL